MTDIEPLEPLGPTALAPFAESPDEGLEKIFGFDDFRKGQREVVEHLLEGDDALVVMPTGSGKSLCYQLTGALTQGVTLVVSPLIALMKDQIDTLRRTGLPATEINSSMSWAEQQERIDRMRVGDYKIVYVAPERFRSDSFCKALSEVEIGLLAIDEAHCISQWGHDFRPDYRRLADIREQFGEPQTVATTATATEFVQKDIVEQLGVPDADIIVSGFERPNLYFEIFHARSKNGKLRRLDALTDYYEGESIIVYAATRKQVRNVCEDLKAIGVDAGLYHAGLDDAERSEIQEKWMEGEVPVLVATNAFGMGVDKPDVRAVVHFNMPGSIEAYYQEAGRAGRDGEEAHCVLLFNYADTGIHEWFADNSYPERADIEKVWEICQKMGVGQHDFGMRDFADKIGEVTIVHSMAAESALRQLAGAGHVRKNSRGLEILDDVPASKLRVDFDRIDQRRKIAHDQVENVADYASTNGCCQAALLEHFGSEASFGEECGHCSGCNPPPAYAEENADALSRTIVTSDDPDTVLKKVLSGLARARGKRGATAVAGMLVGSRAKDVKRAGFTELSTYGILDDLRKKDATYLIDQVAQFGLVKRNEHGCVLLTDKGADVMRDEAAPPNTLAARLNRCIDDPSSASSRSSSRSRRSYDYTRGTYQATLKLHREGMSVADIADERDLSPRTVSNHIITLAAGGVDLDLDVDPQRMDQLREVAPDWQDGDKLRPVKDALPDDWTYPILKRHLAALLTERDDD